MSTSTTKTISMSKVVRFLKEHSIEEAAERFDVSTGYMLNFLSSAATTPRYARALSGMFL